LYYLGPGADDTEGGPVRVSKNDTICGLAAPTARQLMRAYYDDRPVEVACDILGVGQDAARNQMRAFEAAGYVERSGLAHTAGEEWWATTVKGNALANASFGKPISRATATRLLGEVIERARAYKADPARLLTVTEIVVFGSYVNPAADPLGDLDLAVSTVRRGTDGQRYVDEVLKYARASGRSFSAFHDRLFWAARELRMILKNGSPAISITDEDIRKLTARFDVVYAVGDDPDAIPPPQDAVAEK
jgi:predicted nucleotidyltransferase